MRRRKQRIFRVGRAWWGAVPTALLALLSWVIARNGRIPYPDARLAADHYTYIVMARHPFDRAALLVAAQTPPFVRSTPFCWRVLTPLLVHLSHLPILAGFWLTTLIGLFGTLGALAWFLRGLRLPARSVIAGCVAFIFLAPAVAFTLWDYLLIDPLAFCLLTLALGCVVHRRHRLLILTLALGAAAKETTILAALFALCWSLEEQDRPLLGAAVVGTVCWGAVTLLLRHAIPFPYSFLTEAWAIYRPGALAAAGHTIPLRLLWATGATWGLLLPFAALQLIHAPRIWRRPSFAVVLGLATAQVLVSWAVERVVVYAFPVVIAAAALEIDTLAGGRVLRWWALWSAVWVWGVLLTLAGGITLLPTPRVILLHLPYSYDGAALVAVGLTPLVLIGAYAVRLVRSSPRRVPVAVPS